MLIAKGSSSGSPGPSTRSSVTARRRRRSRRRTSDEKGASRGAAPEGLFALDIATTPAPTKDEVAAELTGKLRARAEAFGVEVRALGIRDVILPGEMKEILNPTLMRLRELEVLEKVADKANLTVVLGEGGLAERVVKLL